MKQTIKILELFGGIGAPRKALTNCGFNVKTIGYVEWWTWAAAAYNALFDNNYQPTDVKTWNLNVDLLFHGSPCQDWSNAGKKDLRTGRSLLYLRTLAIIKELKTKPKYIIWENVIGLISEKHQSYFQHYLKELTELGYTNTWKILNAKDFGIPQSRKRVFVVSIRNDLPQTFNFDNLPTQPMQSLLNFINIHETDVSYFIKSQSMQKAVTTGRVKIIDQYVNTITTKQDRWNNAGALPVPLTNECWEIKEYQDFKNFITIPRNSDGKLINGSYNRFWKINAYTGTVAATNPLKIAIPIVVKNQDHKSKMLITNDQHADETGLTTIPTIITNNSFIIPAINPIPHISIFMINNKPYHLRILTPKETWLLMGFTNQDFAKVQHIPKTHLYHMAGNSIVVPVLEAIFKELLKDFASNAIH